MSMNKALIDAFNYANIPSSYHHKSLKQMGEVAKPMLDYVTTDMVTDIRLGRGVCLEGSDDLLCIEALALYGKSAVARGIRTCMFDYFDFYKALDDLDHPVWDCQLIVFPELDDPWRETNPFSADMQVALERYLMYFLTREVAISFFAANPSPWWPSRMMDRLFSSAKRIKL